MIPEGEAEFETEAAIGHDVGQGVGEEYGYTGRYEVTFAQSRNEIYGESLLAPWRADGFDRIPSP
ncbi:hypothetical protein [Streptomyces chartreusis]